MIITSWLLLLLVPKSLLLFSFRTTTSLKSTLTPSVSPITPTTYDQAWVKSVWTVTRWCCPSTTTVSPAWRSCLWESTAELAVFFKRALLLKKGFPTTNAEGMTDILKNSGKRYKTFLPIYSLSGQNATFSISIFWLKRRTRHLHIPVTNSIKSGQTHLNFSSLPLNGKSILVNPNFSRQHRWNVIDEPNGPFGWYIHYSPKPKGV